MLDYTDRLSSTTTMGYVFPLVRTVHVIDLNTDDGDPGDPELRGRAHRYYEACVVEEEFLQDVRV